GLFSAVATTFVAQTYQNLQANYTAMSRLCFSNKSSFSALSSMVPSVDAISPSPSNPSTVFCSRCHGFRVNGLRFVSLFLSLTIALVTVLVKQWLHYYVVLPSGTPYDHSFTRQFRYAGFQKWHVQVIVGFLPVPMHIALAIFLIGLVIFLPLLREALSWIICAATTIVYAAYVTMTILPILFPQCPYHTPLYDLVYVSPRHITPHISWKKYNFLDAWRQRSFSAMIRRLPDVKQEVQKH
ncbi:hypothetical protein DFS33DRAFT_1251854, partial [Desarmillaria ectypa]